MSQQQTQSAPHASGSQVVEIRDVATTKAPLDCLGVDDLARRTPRDLSHDLRTPLTALRLHLEEALMYPEDLDPSVTLRAAMRYVMALERNVTDFLSSSSRGCGAQVPSQEDGCPGGHGRALDLGADGDGAARLDT
ncbi:histidine kinase dimerization/phospho-acceptor domain-containing protein [Actinomadura verrucosospora]